MISLHFQRTLSKQVSQVFKFSTAGEVAQTNFEKFQSTYHSHLRSFQEKIRTAETETKQKLKKPDMKVYTHPFDYEHQPLNFSPVKTAELFYEFVGPEQVSPHYENFLVARKYLVTAWGAWFVFSIGASTVDLSWIMKMSIIPMLLWINIMYFYIEGRKSMLKPLLARFYRRAVSNEMHMFDVFYHENIENKLRTLIGQTKSQLEYWEVHRNYQTIKGDSINNFLATEYLNLQRSIYDRTVSILKQAQQYEEINRNQQLQNLLNAATQVLDNKLIENKEVQEKMLDAAIEGLSKGKMDYVNDPILPLIQKAINDKVKAITSLSEEEQDKLVALTEDQLKSIRDSDTKAKQDYLSAPPKGIDPSLRNSESLKKVFENWGKN